MKVLLINNSYPNKKYPEKSTYIQSIKECIESSNNEVDVLVLNTTDTNKKINDYINFYLKIIKFNLNKYNCLYINHYTFLIPLFFKIPFYKGNVIFHWHGEELVVKSNIFKILRFFCKLTIKKNHYHISPSNYYKQTIENVLKVKSDKILVSPSGGVDITIFKERENREITDKKELHIGFASDLSEHKGIHYYYDLILHSKEIELKVKSKVYFHYIKYGKEASYWENIFSKFKNVIMHNKYPKKDISKFYQQIDICMMLSKRESLGLVALESMACNVPVIARNTTSMPEIVKSGISGEIVSFDPSTKELIDKIYTIKSSYTQYNARNYVSAQYSKENVISFYSNLFNSLT